MTIDTAMYMANKSYKEAPESALPGTKYLEVLAKKYVADHDIKPRSEQRWKSAFPEREGAPSLYTYSNNFEVGKVEFFLREDVRNWTGHVLDSGGIHRYRWGDAGLRYLTLALFASEAEVLHIENFNIQYCHPCFHEEEPSNPSN